MALSAGTVVQIASICASPVVVRVLLKGHKTARLILGEFFIYFLGPEE